MKRYNITVNGRSYEVAVEELRGGAAPAAPAEAPLPPTAAREGSQDSDVYGDGPPPAAAQEAAPAAASKAAAGQAGARIIKAPMPGTVLAFSVEPGQVVKRGDVVLILEAMKMQNEIVAQADGTIVALRQAPGAAVNTGDPLVEMT